MPTGAKHPCRQSGCAKLLDKPGYCNAHRRNVFKQKKSKADKDYVERNRFYQRKSWKDVRARRLSIEPLCRACRKSGRLVAATIVDHIVPISDGGERLDLNNTQSLCQPCHSRKTLSENVNHKN